MRLRKHTIRRIISLGLAGTMVLSMSVGAFAQSWYLEDGDIKVKADKTGRYVSQGKTSKKEEDDETIITQRDNTNSTEYNVTIEAEDGANAEVTIKDVNIEGKDADEDAPITIKAEEGSKVTIELDGDNKVKAAGGHAGVEKNDTDGTGELIIKDDDNDGSLDAIGSAGNKNSGAGIGSSGNKVDTSNITIKSGNIKAVGADDEKVGAAGIGGGNYSSANNITVEGGNVTAIGGNGPNGHGGAGIGGGSQAPGFFGKKNIISINGGTVTATGGEGGAGIGGGGYAIELNKISITGSSTNVTATAGYGGAGIGRGRNSSIYDDGEEIVITDATVEANGSGGGAGIGSGKNIYFDGFNYKYGQAIIINGKAKVTAKGSCDDDDKKASAGVGMGYTQMWTSMLSSPVTVDDDAELTAYAGSEYAASIGASSGKQNRSTISILDKAKVKLGVKDSESGGFIGGGIDPTTGEAVADNSNAKYNIDCTAEINGQHITSLGDAAKKLIHYNDANAVKLNHIGNEVEEIIKEPNCTEKGEKAFRCSGCNGVLRTEEIPVDPDAHDYQLKDSKEATCTEAGYRYYECTHNAEHNYNEIIPIDATAHDYRLIDEKAATCTEAGYKYYECTYNREHSYNEVLPIDPTAHDYHLKDHKDATCTEDGYDYFECTYNPDHNYKETIAANGHKWSEWVTVKEPTYTEEGIMQRTCSVCSEVETQSIARLVREEDGKEDIWYWVTPAEGGEAAPYSAYSEGDTLVVTASADNAVLHVELDGWADHDEVKSIRFVTNGKATTIAAAEMLAQGSVGELQLTHRGGEAALAINGAARTDLFA